LDTREKIVPLEKLGALLRDGEWLAVVGTFDPLTLSQAERLAEVSRKGKSVLAVVEPGAGCLLPVEARAVLVAAVKSVQLVVVAETSALPKHPQMEIMKDDDGEHQRSRAFAEHVRGRQGAR
jgi:hypothetical protein